MRSKQAGLSVSVGLIVALASCMGPPGPDGVLVLEAGAPGPVGPSGPNGPSDAGAPRARGVAGPGLKAGLSDAKIDASGVATVTVTFSDGAGNPVDRLGAYTDGAVVAGFALSSLAPGGQYTAFTRQPHTSLDGTRTETLADADLGGTFTETADGTYVYRFGSVVPQVNDATRTHTVGLWAYRDFQGKRYVVNTVLDFVPAGGPVTSRRELVTTRTCNQCHNPLATHEGDTVRREASLCILCHADGMRDATNGNSLDLRVAVHKIHQGKALPSVLSGKPYVLHMNKRADDFSTVWFPTGDARNCPSCHQPAQGERWFKSPSQAACGSCHDNIVFTGSPPFPAGIKLHSGGAQVDDSLCTTCHVPTGTPLAIIDVHSTSLTDPSATKLELAIVSVTGTAPGQTPVLRFNAKSNGATYDVLAHPFTTLAVTLAGPTSDYASAVKYPIQGPGALGTLTAVGADFVYTFPAPIPADATGTYAVGMEASLDVTLLPPRSYSPNNPIAYVAVTDPAPVPRRAVVERAKCNSCHVELAAHGGTAKSPDYCVLCHSPGKVNDQQVSRFQVPTTVASSMNFKVMVHKIHRGTKLTKQPYVLGGAPAPSPTTPSGNPIDFGKVRFPGNTVACWACHASTSYMLPLPKGQVPTRMTQVLSCNDGAPNPAAYCASRSAGPETFLSPAGAACAACHDSSGAEAHVRVMVGSDGTETCETCHGVGKQWDVQTVHVLPP